ncbi:CBS domain-containing protein [uncultured Methanocorpusculum sp.]|nr:CBS domain-containing protein [uncultured Methanocorpusculum sp.]
MEKKQVRDYMTHDVISIDASGTVGDVIRLIRTTDHDGFPVLRLGKVVGYISARDIIGEYPSTKVELRMTRHPITARPEVTITEVARRIFRTGIQKLPVIGPDNELLGIISNMDVIRSQIERVTPEKVFNFMRALHALYGVETHLKREHIPVKDIQPTQSSVHQDELEGRTYELQKNLAEPVIVVKSGERTILVDGHHRAVAAEKLGLRELDAYVVYLDADIELGLEKTAHAMNIFSIKDIKIDDSPERSLVLPTQPKLIPTEKKLVSEYMTTNVISLDAGKTVKDVIGLIRTTTHDGFPVLCKGRVVGLIGAKDIIGAKATDGIAPLMEPVILKTQPNEGMTDVARKMFRFCVQKLPVIDTDGQFIGIITNADVIRSQIERVTPEKVFDYMTTLKKLYGLDPLLSRGMVPVRSLIPTQSKVYMDELDGRAYEIKKGLAEPLIVVRRKGKYILIDGHHRAVAANRMRVPELEAYLIDIDSDTELGIEKTSRNMRLWSLDDVQIMDESRCTFLA